MTLKEIFKIFKKKRYKSDNFTKKIKAFIGKNKPRSKKGNLLVWEMGGFPLILVKNAIVSLAMKLRGYQPQFMICDGTPEACIQRDIISDNDTSKWNLKCKGCFKNMTKMAERYNAKYHTTSDFINRKKVQEFRDLSESINIKDIKDYKFLKISIGEVAYITFNRYMKGLVVNIKDIKDPSHLKIYRKYFFASLVNAHIAENSIKKFTPSAILSSHGVYTDYAFPSLIGSRDNIPFMNWGGGFSKFCHYFSSKKEQNTAEKSHILPEKQLTKKEDERLSWYYNERYFSSSAIDIPDSARGDNSIDISKQLKISGNNKTVCLFCHINWDACLAFSETLFLNANEWVLESIKKMSEIKDVNWIIKIHPGEEMDGSFYTTHDLLKEYCGKLPPNITVVGFDSAINNHSLYSLIDCGITIFGTVGVELPCFGKPIITAGEAHFANKGFTIDPKTKDEYFSILQNVSNIKPLDKSKIKLARKYAYLYFIKKQVPINVIKKDDHHWGNLDVEQLDRLIPGRNAVMDQICDSIVKGEDIILNDKSLKQIENER